MKILMVHNPYQLAGGEDFVFEQERRMLENAGHEVVTYLRNNDEVNQYSGFRRLRIIPQTIWARDSRTDVSALLAREKPAIVHVHNTFVMISPSIFSACEEAGVPVVQTLHNYRLMCPAGAFYRDGHVCEECLESLWAGIRHGCYHDSKVGTAVVASMIAVHRRLRTWSRPSHYYIALCKFARQKFVDAGLPGDRIFVKPNFVHPDPGASGNEDKEQYAVFAGRLSPEKRVGGLLDAWERGTSRFPLFILGAGPERAGLEQAARQRGLSGIHFKGQVPRGDVIATIRKARFLVLSSEIYENFPVTIAEAFACGTPVICARMGAMEEIVADGRTGLHYRPGQIDDLAEKMDWAWNNPVRMGDMGRRARREYETKYTAEINYKRLMDIYQQVLGQAEECPLVRHSDAKETP